MASIWNYARSDAEIIRAAADSIDHDEVLAQALLSPSDKLQRMFALIEHERQIMYAEESQQHPDENEELVWRRVRDRILDQQDLSDEVRADLREWIRKKETGATTL